MRNGHLSSFMGWIAYNFGLWLEVRYAIGATMNDLTEAKEVPNKTDYRMLNICGIVSKYSREENDNICTQHSVDLDYSALLPSN